MTFAHSDRRGLSNAQRLLSCCMLILLLTCVVSAQARSDRFKSFRLQTIDGAARTLQDYQDKATLVAFFFPSCGYCNQALPETVKIYNKYRAQGLAMVWINIVPDEVKQIPAWQAQHHYQDIPVLVGASQRKLQRDYRIQMSPEHLLIDPHGKILFRQRGYHAGNEKTLEQHVRQALGLGGQPMASSYSP